MTLCQLFFLILPKLLRTMNQNWVEIIGYAASIFVVLSFVLKDIKKIRIINLIGCTLFVIYGFLNKKLWPVIIPNAFLFFIQIYYLLNITKGKNVENNN